MKTIAVSIVLAAIAIAGAMLLLTQSGTYAQGNANSNILQALSPNTGELPSDLLFQGRVYIPSTPDSVMWGALPNRDAEPLLTIASGSVVTFDTVSHEGILEDQGRDPERYFALQGILPEQVLDDAIMIAASDLSHDFDKDGPHVVTGPIAIEGAAPGDVLKIEVLALLPRVPYGVISSRHGKGALPGDFPENDGRLEGAGVEQPGLYNSVSVFTRIEEVAGDSVAILHNRNGEEIRFPINPFMGIMGVAPDTSEIVNSVPPAAYGGNLDINELGVGSILYLPIQVAGALFYTGDPHYAQGDGEVALTALEAPLRATFRLTLLAAGDSEIPGGSPFTQPFGETEEYWIPIGLDPDLDEAMKQAVREGIDFLSTSLGVDRATAYAYMSAATDFEVSQVVDRNKGVHGLIRKSDFGAAVP
jgi:acetamidase/formamidase